MRPCRLAGFALLAVAASCRDAVGPRQEVTDLAAARQRWTALNLHTYAFTLQRSCFCANVHPLYVLVLSDTIAGVLDLETAEVVDRQFGETIDGLFAFVQTAIDNHAYLIHAEYDGAKGFPTEIQYDGSAQIADDEVSFRASDVHAVTPPS